MSIQSVIPGRAEQVADRAAQSAADVRDALRRLGSASAHDALAILNTRVRFRFTGLFAIEGPVLRNVALFDRENPALCVSGDVCRLSDTYCALVEATACAFTTPDSLGDVRLADHPARLRVVSYAGVPIRVNGASGTLCHWDSRPRLLPSGELTILEEVAPLLGRYLTSRMPS